uniref:Uncharacterized protein n=1 Tax=Setaria digitata TaxID=48799 RepID=A0A915PVN4_9BILA
MKQLEKKLEKCSNKCWDRDATKITTRPDNLWQCFVQQKPIADRLIRCIKSNIKSCANSKNGPQIPKQDIRRIISLTGEKIEAAKDRISSNPALQPIRKILDTALEIGKCVKDCLIEGDGIIACFEKHALVQSAEKLSNQADHINRCQPQINLNRSRRTILKCIKQIGWRKAAGEMCKCTMEAGVSGLTSICPIFDLATRD